MTTETIVKAITLNRRHVMHREGFTHALRFNQYDPGHVGPIERWLHNTYGNQFTYNPMWKSRFGKNKDKVTSRTPYWIGVKAESMLTMALLIGAANVD